MIVQLADRLTVKCDECKERIFDFPSLLYQQVMKDRKYICSKCLIKGNSHAKNPRLNIILRLD